MPAVPPRRVTTTIWYSVCLVPASLFGLLPRYVLFASSVWTGFALAAIIPLYLKHFFRKTQALNQRSLFGIALLAVSGLDLLPVSLLYLAKRQEDIRHLFQSPRADWRDADALCNSLSINVLLVTRDDAVWQNADSWVWRREPVVANSFLRTFACGTAQMPD
jgi:hypothetical protein